MKGFIKVATLSLLLFSISFSVNAQIKGQNEKAQEEVNKLKFALDLDDETTEELYEVYLTTQITLKKISMDAINGVITKEEEKKETKYVWKTHVAHVEAVIGKDLVEAYKNFRNNNNSEKENVN